MTNSVEMKEETIIEETSKIDFTNLNEVEKTPEVKIASKGGWYNVTTAKGTYNVDKPVGG